MGFVFSRRIQLLPFLAVNISKSGISWSIGRPGANVNVGDDGVRLTGGVPGSGASYRKQFGQFKLSRPVFWGVSAVVLLAVLGWRWYTGQGLPHNVLHMLQQLQHASNALAGK